MDRQGLTVAEAGRYSGIGRNELYRLLNTGAIPALRIGRRILIPKASLDTWMIASAEADAEARKASIR